MRVLNVISFRQLLLLAFLLIAALLAAASLRGLQTLEYIVKEGRESASGAVELTADAQQLAERTVAMERAARQFLVLEDPALRERFEETVRDVDEPLSRLAAGLPDDSLARAWQAQLDIVRQQVNGPRSTVRDREAALTLAFRQLDQTNTALSAAVRQLIAEQNERLLERLDNGRQRLAQQMLSAIGLTIVLALGLGFWLGRPLKRLEKAIVGLGENRLDVPVDIRGPADLRSLGRQLDWLRLRLMELDTDKARFLRHVSHELKTPLAALREGTALLEEGIVGELNPQQQEVVRILLQHTAQLQAQIEDLLRFNAAAFEARQLRPERVALAGLIRRLVDEQRLQWQSRQLRVELQGEAEAEVDPEKFAVALGNLLSNAIRFSPPGGVIRFTLSRLKDAVGIDIVDDGPGVAPDDQERVFEPFYRGERQPGDAMRGTGIGLSIVQEYIAAHGGSIRLLPSGRGAHFRIELPYADKH